MLLSQDKNKLISFNKKIDVLEIVKEYKIFDNNNDLYLLILRKKYETIYKTSYQEILGKFYNLQDAQNELTTIIEKSINNNVYQIQK